MANFLAALDNGLTTSRFELGAVGTGIHVDGALDTVTVVGCRVSPRGHVSVQHGLGICSAGQTVAERFPPLDRLNRTTFGSGMRYEAGMV